MLTRRRVVLAGFLFAATATALALLPSVPGTAPSNLPERLTDREFWSLSSSFSEPGGTFHSDNFVSNEGQYQTVIPDLIARAKQGGVYVGVGPEQNFTYLAALRPRMAFIVDIRRGNLHEHLLYKALFEMSADRAEFLARLFVRERPAGLTRGSSAEELFAALESMPATEARYRENLQAVTNWLTERHAFPLDVADREGIAYVYRAAFFADGPDLNYRLTGQRGTSRGGRGTPTYAELMTADDGDGNQRSYLARDENFAFVKGLHERNLIVPVVGDFGGTKALRAVGRYAREHDAVVTALYASNVEQYLRPDGKWDAFCGNVASMPLDAASTFIRSVRGGGGQGAFARFRSSLGNMQAETRGCAARHGPSRN